MDLPRLHHRQVGVEKVQAKVKTGAAK